MFIETDVKKYQLTRKLCNHIASLPEWKGERKLRQPRLDFLKSRLDRGAFHSPVWATVTCRGKTYRVNGQHSSTMLSQCNGEFPSHLSAIVYEFTAQNERDVAELFNQFDSRESSRTTVEVVNAHRHTDEILARMGTDVIIRAINGIRLFRLDGKASRVTDDERAAMIHENKEFISWFNSVNNRLIRLGGHVAAVYATWLVDPDEARKFWLEVCEASHPDRSNPSRVLERFLRESIGDQQKAGGTKKLTQFAVACKCIHAWNAWRKGVATNLRYVKSTKSLPKAI